ncbi:MAG: TolC family protein, partial [Chitinophagia bacterium]|nr:TolC family protein [Chitinophagia bacterium]
MRQFFSTLIIAIATSAAAQEPLRMSVDECMNYALKNSYTQRNAQLDVLIQQSQNSQTAALAYPSVNGKYEFNYFPRPQQSFLNGKVFGGPDGIVPVAFTIPFSSTASLTASQILFDGSVLVALQARQAVLELAKQKEALSRQTIQYNVYKSYFTCVIAEKQLNILVNSIAFARVIANEAEAAYRQGLVEKIVMERAQVQVNNYENDSANTANSVVTLYHLLKYQMGMDINTPLALTDTNIDAHTSQAMQTLNTNSDLKGLIQYRMALSGVRLNEFNLKRYQMSALPSVVGIGAFGCNYGAEFFKNLYKMKSYESYSLVGLQINLPIFNGFKRMQQVKEARLNIEKAQNDLENTSRSLDLQTTNARTVLRNNLVLLKSQQ